MYSDAKNMTNYLVESETLPMFALPNVAIRNIIRYIQSLFKAEFLLQYLTCCDIARLATKRGSALFLHTLTNFCLTKCQTWTKVPVRRIVTLLHPYLSGKRFTVATSRKRNFPKKSTNLFAKSRTLCTFVSANILKSISDTVIYFIAKTRSAVSVSVQCVCQNIKGLRFLCVHTLTNFCSEQWQTRTRVSTRRTVTSLQPYLSGKRFISATSRKHSFPNLPNSIKLLSTASIGIHPSPAVCAPASPTCIGNVIRTWLSVGLSLPLWRGRRSPESTKSTSASRSRELLNPKRRRSRLLLMPI